jgi:Ran-binding protein 3
VNVPQASEGIFASSGFGKLASASASPFGAAKGLSAFGAPATKSAFASSSSAFGAPKDATAPMQPSAFGASAGGSVFGSGTSVFGSGSSTSIFGSTAKTGGLFGSSFAANKPGSSSFAGGSGPKIEGLSAKPSKPFGAAEESEEELEEDDEDEDDEGHKSPTHVTDEAAAKKDKRFYEQEVETGEEGEKTLFTSRAKLFSFVKNADGTGAWKERGSGFIKVNVRDVELGEDDEQEREAENETEKGEDGKAKETAHSLKAEKKKARFILRANGTNRLVLNSPVEKHTPFGQPGGNGARPTGKTIMFMGVLDSGAMQMLQLSVC